MLGRRTKQLLAAKLANRTFYSAIVGGFDFRALGWVMFFSLQETINNGYNGRARARRAGGCVGRIVVNTDERRRRRRHEDAFRGGYQLKRVHTRARRGRPRRRRRKREGKREGKGDRAAMGGGRAGGLLVQARSGSHGPCMGKSGEWDEMRRGSLCVDRQTGTHRRRDRGEWQGIWGAFGRTGR